MADILSQEELDALLGQMKDGDEDDVDAAEIPPEPEESRGGSSASEPPAEAAPPVVDKGNVELILNIPVTVSVELGRTRMSVLELLQLGQGSVIELDRLAKDMIDLTINKRVVAHGEAVVVTENFGFRVLRVESVQERIRKL